MDYEIMKREIWEASQAGERALNSLYGARERLNSAKNWGIFDMVGGGFFSSLMKHSKLDDAARDLEEAKRSLQIFQKELRDVQIRVDLKVDIGGFLSFADFFFDGLVTDYLVQSRISEARAEVEEAIDQVETVLEQLQYQERRF